MNALVLLQHGLDVTLALELRGDGMVQQHGDLGIAVTNPPDRCALEWAMRTAAQVTALTIGSGDAQAVVELAMARGAQRGIRVWDDAWQRLDASAMSRILARVLEILTPDLVLAGERGLEGATGILPALVAARLGWPCLSAALRVVCKPDGVLIEQPLGGGRRQQMFAGCPVVLTVAPGSIEPRYVSVRARQQAAQRGVETWDLARLGLTAETVLGWVRLSLERLDWPRPRPRRTTQAATSRNLSAAERLRQLTAGTTRVVGSSQATASEKLLEGEPGHIADRLLAFLESRGVV